MKKIRFLLFAALLLPACAFAQKDRTSEAYFYWDSIEIHLARWHSQNAAQDTIMFASQYVSEYFYTDNGLLYSQIPLGYVAYGTHEPDRPMVIVHCGKRTKTYNAHDLIGNKVELCSTLEPALVWLNL